MAQRKQQGTLISVEQAAEVIGIPDYTLRRALTEGMRTLKIVQTSGKHRRIALRDLLGYAERELVDGSKITIERQQEIVEELHQRRRDSRWEDAPVELDPEKSKQLRDTLRETIDADAAAKALGVSRPTLRRWELEGKIIGTRPLGPKQVRYFADSIEQIKSLGAHRFV